MDISKKITKNQFKEILLYALEKGEGAENLEVNDLINDIKHLIISTINSSNRS